MKKIFYLILVLFIAFIGGFAGVKQSYKENQKVTKVTTTTAPEVKYTTKEKSNIKEAIKKALPTVVEIRAETVSVDFFNQKSKGTSLGSGVIISADGNIITNNHVIRGANRVIVKTSDSKEHEAHLIGTDAKTDLAVIKIDIKNSPFSQLADSDKTEMGDDALVIGNPLGEGISASNGIISALNKEVTVGGETMHLLQTNAAVNQGNSGGGLFNINGDLVGIVNAKSGSGGLAVSVEGLGYAIPSNVVKKIASDILANGYVKNRPTLGVQLINITQENNAFVPGVYIISILPNSAADKAGLQKYDQILAVNEQKVKNYSDISNILQKHSINDEITLTINRNDKEIKVKVILQEAQAADKNK